MWLCQYNARDVKEFEWQMQLRYFYENKDVVVWQVGCCGHCDFWSIVGIMFLWWLFD